MGFFLKKRFFFQTLIAAEEYLYILLLSRERRKEKSCCPPLASVKHMVVTMQQDYQIEWIVVTTSFRDSLHWMAPALEILSVIKCWDDFDQEITSTMRVPIRRIIISLTILKACCLGPPSW